MSLKFHQVLSRPSIRGFLLKELTHQRNGVNQAVSKTVVKASLPLETKEFALSLAALNIHSIYTPPASEPAKGRIPPPLPLSRVIQLPEIHKNESFEDQLPTKSVEDPTPSQVQEKQAARMIVIRRKKMKKHKLKKLRKKMKFYWAKVRQKRELAKEKRFQAALLEHIRVAKSFDPAKYAAEKIAKSKEVELPPVWYGVKYPDFIIKQLMDEKEQKEKEKEADEKRRASMSPYVKDYLDKLPK